ncbi:DUF3850 domain-containing protein [Candidatus Berkelbacteria bacterium]|nr:DUF3850 domain-containing protein [Candidatus Berkelbacteria bacterium]
MAIIKKKIWPVNFIDVASCKKKYELRLGDDVYHEGDTLILEEWDPQTSAYTGRSLRRTITSVASLRLTDLTQMWKQSKIDQHGLVLLSIEA